MTLLNTSFERFWSIFSDYEFFFDFLSLFATKTVYLIFDWFSFFAKRIFQYIPFWMQKSIKMYENLLEIHFYILCIPKGSKLNYKGVLTIRSIQNRFSYLCFFLKFCMKNRIFAQNRKIHPTLRLIKIWSRIRMTLSNTSIESLNSIFSISNFIFIFSCLFVTQTVSGV